MTNLPFGIATRVTHSNGLARAISDLANRGSPSRGEHALLLFLHAARLNTEPISLRTKRVGVPHAVRILGKSVAVIRRGPFRIHQRIIERIGGPRRWTLEN